MIRDHARSRDERELAEGEAGGGSNRLRFEGGPQAPTKASQTAFVIADHER
jgi:hypothetical protein